MRLIDPRMITFLSNGDMNIRTMMGVENMS